MSYKIDFMGHIVLQKIEISHFFNKNRMEYLLLLRS